MFALISQHIQKRGGTLRTNKQEPKTKLHVCLCYNVWPVTCDFGYEPEVLVRVSVLGECVRLCVSY